jgi:hypothetical protein
MISTQELKYRLQLNFNKCTAITLCGSASHTTLEGFQQLVLETATLLGAPLSTSQAMTDSLSACCADLSACCADLSACCADLSRAVEQVKLISAHDALLLLKKLTECTQTSSHTAISMLRRS